MRETREKRIRVRELEIWKRNNFENKKKFQKLRKKNFNKKKLEKNTQVKMDDDDYLNKYL